MAKPTVRQQRLGSELRQLRQQAGVSAAEAGQVLDLKASMLFRIENGTRGVRSPDVVALLDKYGVTDPKKRAALVKLAREAKREDWFAAYNDVLSKSFRYYLSLESEATAIRSFEPLCVFGLLQTEVYARAVIADHHRADAFEKWMKVRMERQEILERSDAPVVHAILDESILRRPIGGREVLREQLQHLAGLAERPNITVQVLPHAVESGVVAIGGAFTSLEFTEQGGAAVFLEHVMGGDFLSEPDAIETYGVIFGRLQELALAPDASVEMITKTAKELGQDDRPS